MQKTTKTKVEGFPALEQVMRKASWSLSTHLTT